MVEVVFVAVLGVGTLLAWHRLRASSVRLPAGKPQDRAEAVRRVLKHVQRRPIAELEEGMAAVVVGTAVERERVPRLRAPLTGYECIGFHLDIRRAELDAASQYPQVYERAAIVEIEVQDATGTIRVDAADLELAITGGPPRVCYPPLPPVLRAFVPPALHHSPISFEEGLLQPGDRILVAGVVARDPLPTDYRDGGSVLVMRASPRFPLVASTDPDLVVPGEAPLAPEELARRR